MTGVARNTVTTLLLDLAEACAGYHDRYVRNLKVRRLQCDEIWNFVGAKAKNSTPGKKAEGLGRYLEVDRARRGYEALR